MLVCLNEERWLCRFVVFNVFNLILDSAYDFSKDCKYLHFVLLSVKTCFEKCVQFGKIDHVRGGSNFRN